MAPIEWSPTLELGIKNLDDQHRELIEALNTLLAARRAGTRACSARDVVTRLRAFADAHFHIEEGYMRAFGYPDAKTHQQEHQDYLAAVDRLEAACAGGAGNPEAALGFLETWIRGHLPGADRRLGRFLYDYLR